MARPNPQILGRISGFTSAIVACTTAVGEFFNRKFCLLEWACNVGEFILLVIRRLRPSATLGWPDPGLVRLGGFFPIEPSGRVAPISGGLTGTCGCRFLSNQAALQTWYVLSTIGVTPVR